MVETFDYRQILLGSDRHWIFSDQGYHFRMGRSWERLLQLHKLRELRTKDGSHIVPIRICGYLIKHMCKEEERWMWWKLKSDNKVPISSSSFSGFFFTCESIHSNLDLLSLLLFWEVYNSYSHMTVLLEFESNYYITH